MRRREELLLAGLAGVGICVVGGGIVSAILVFAEARARAGYERRLAEYDADMAGPLDVCVAARELLRAQQRVPWSDRLAAHNEYLERIGAIESRAHSLADIGLFGDDASRLRAKREAEEVTSWRVDAAKRAD
jgi:glycine/D-amino acid oxidase-like deaminating enzyme